MIEEIQAELTASALSLTDTYCDDRKAGSVIGTRTPEGVRRGGVDKEKSIAIDNGALRIQPLIQPGWGRAGIAYPPFRRQNGLTLAVFMLNGHNTSQVGGIGEPLRSRLERWLDGSEAWGRGSRIVQWLRSGRIGRAVRQFRWWIRLDRHAKTLPKLDENLAVGWFSSEAPENPLSAQNAFVMHAMGPENGELWAMVGATPLPAIQSVQNLQIYYVIVLRAKGAAYYAASVRDANGLPAYPEMRPLAIDPFNETAEMFPGIHQSVLGQIGFRLDTRVYGTRVEQCPEMTEWYGSAHLAERFGGKGVLHQSHSEAGGRWKVFAGEFQRGLQGAKPLFEENLAVLDAPSPSGLVHLLYQTHSTEDAVGIVWRFRDEENYWRLLIDDRSARLSVREGGAWSDIAVSDRPLLQSGAVGSLQLLDDGETMSFHLQGELLFGTRFRDRRLQTATGAGVYAAKGSTEIHSFEAHPCLVPLPAALRMGEPWLRKGANLVLEDRFEGPAGELEGRMTPTGGKIWRRQIGTGVMALSGEGAVKIQATAKQPNPGRTAYMVDWDSPDFADVSVEITPPGTGPEQREHGLCGFIFWQDPDNYVTVNIWVNHSYGGASISCFFHVDGFEDLYDAIWSNVGKRVYYGVPLTLRMVFDGEQYMVFVNEEPVLYRALRDVYPHYQRFAIKQVGLMANWEWGNDTGSTFRNFVGKV